MSSAPDLPRLALRDVSVAGVVEDLPELRGDAVGFDLPDEDRVLAVEIVQVVDILPPIRGGVRRRALVPVQDQPRLGLHTAIYRHVPLLCSVMVSTKC